MDQLLDSVHAHNLVRKDSAQLWSVGVYCLIGVAMVLETFVLAILVAWATPGTWLASLPRNNKDVRLTIGYWLYPALLLFFLLTGGAGMAGWMVAGGLYFVLIVVFAIIGQARVYRNKSALANAAADSSGGRNASPATSSRVDPAIVYRKRVERMFRHYSPNRLRSTDELLRTSKGNEAKMMAKLVAKFGPEPTTPPIHGFDVMDADPESGTASASPTAAATGGPSSSVPTATAGPSGSEASGENTVNWARAPQPMTGRQAGCCFVSFALFLAFFCGIMLMVYVWEIKDYQLIERVNVTGSSAASTTSLPVQKHVEFIPQMTAKAVALMYSWPHFTTDCRLEIFVHILTDHCGTRFREQLDTVAQRRVIFTDWIEKYNISMDEYSPEDWAAYGSVNAWFIRKLAPGMRPLQFPGNDLVINSPADSRMLIFNNLSDSRVWVKGAEFNYRELVDDEVIDNDPHYWDDGTMVIARLAPQDYHRFHAPVTGRIHDFRKKEGTFWSVNADAAQSDNYVFYNERQIVIIDAGPPLEKVAFVAIGATCVGSVMLEREDGSPLQKGQTITRGDQLGLMQFGGSTVILLFKKGVFLPNCDLHKASAKPVEMYVKLREAIGMKNTNYTFDLCVDGN